MLAWTEDEDEQLRVLIEQHGTKKWALIASILKTKSSKQCRRRWKNTLDMEAKATTWSPNEDALLIKYHRELGNKWTAISKKFGDRTDNAVKNRWNALVRRQPELAEEDSPVTTIGVRRGTRTRALDSGGSSGSDIPASKRRRRGAGAGRSGSGTTSSGVPSSGRGTRGGTSAAANTSAAAAADAAAAAAANFYPPPWGITGGLTGVTTLDGTQWMGVPGMPTPFDLPTTVPVSTAVNITVARDVLTEEEVMVAQALNAKRTPFNIQIAGSDCGIGDGLMGPDPSGLFSGQLPTLPTLPSMPNFGLGGSLPPVPLPDWTGMDLNIRGGSGSGTAAAAAAPGAAGYPSLSMNDLPMNDLLAWLNSTGNGSGEHPLSGSLDILGVRGSADERPLTRRASQRVAAAAPPAAPIAAPAANGGVLFPLVDSGSLPNSLSCSSGLSSGQRDLLARLFSQARDSADVEKQAAAAAEGKKGRTGSGAQQRAEPAPAMQRIVSVGLVRSLSMSMGRTSSLGFGSLNANRSVRSDPMGRTRSSSGRGATSSGFAAAAAAAVAAVDAVTDASAPPAGGMAPPPVRGPQMTRSKRSVGSNGAAATAVGMPMSGPPSFGASDLPVYTQTLTSEDIDKILDALSK